MFHGIFLILTLLASASAFQPANGICSKMQIYGVKEDIKFDELKRTLKRWKSGVIAAPIDYENVLKLLDELYLDNKILDVEKTTFLKKFWNCENH
jgi:hypothetical protein